MNANGSSPTRTAGGTPHVRWLNPFWRRRLTFCVTFPGYRLSSRNPKLAFPLPFARLRLCPAGLFLSLPPSFSIPNKLFCTMHGCSSLQEKELQLIIKGGAHYFPPPSLFGLRPQLKICSKRVLPKRRMKSERTMFSSPGFV